ncbi:MAG TPA: hypothetical protein DCE42_05050 [Myxococcales bacterium]|nr:hypothetical protein [Deltaproteobacteria bacterium]HAA54098.1 hypothetical protein [Myxococcales bacterium]|tara:strand:+ start:8963 stop:9928 length:966 start_codon:yes stop_codon:yes gene_type:complete
MKFMLRTPKKIWMLFLFGAVVVGLSGCKRSGTKLEETKQPNPLYQTERPKVEGHLLASNRRYMYQSATIDLAQANAILGGFVYKAASTYQAKRGGRALLLKHKFTITQRPNGDFHAVVRNNHKKGHDVIWVNGKLYWRGRFRPYRMTSKNLKIAHRWQLRGYGRWRALLGIFGPHLDLQEEGACQQLNRICRKYRVTFRATPHKEKTFEAGTAWAGKVPDKTRGSAAGQPRVPMSASGRLWVDRQSGLVLKVNFRGTYRLGKGQGVVTSVRLDAGFTKTGGGVISPPQKIVQVGVTPQPKDPFARKKPFYFQPPPSRKKKK